MATNASCAIVIEDQADQVGSANDFTCNGVPKKRKASDFLCRNAKLLVLRPRPRWGSLQSSPIPPSWCPPPAPSPGRRRPLLCSTYSHTFHCAPPPPPPLPNAGSATGRGTTTSRRTIGMRQTAYPFHLSIHSRTMFCILNYITCTSIARATQAHPFPISEPLYLGLAPHVCPNSCLQKEIEHLLLGRPSRSLWLPVALSFPSINQRNFPSAILQSIVFVKRFIHLRRL